MIVEPESRVADFAKAGADIISVHAEQSSTIHLHRVVNMVGSTQHDQRRMQARSRHEEAACKHAAATAGSECPPALPLPLADQGPRLQGRCGAQPWNSPVHH
jgi:hypothetical protein